MKQPDSRLIITIHATDSKRFILSLERLAIKAAAVVDASSAQGTYPFTAFIAKKVVTHNLKNMEISNGKLQEVCADWRNDNTASFRKIGSPKSDSQGH